MISVSKAPKESNIWLRPDRVDLVQTISRNNIGRHESRSLEKHRPLTIVSRCQSKDSTIGDSDRTVVDAY